MRNTVTLSERTFTAQVTGHNIDRGAYELNGPAIITLRVTQTTDDETEPYGYRVCDPIYTVWIDGKQGFGGRAEHMTAEGLPSSFVWAEAAAAAPWYRAFPSVVIYSEITSLWAHRIGDRKPAGFFKVEGLAIRADLEARYPAKPAAVAVTEPSPEPSPEPLTKRLAAVLSEAYGAGLMDAIEFLAVNAAVDFIMTDGTAAVVDKFSHRYGRLASKALRTADGRTIV